MDVSEEELEDVKILIIPEVSEVRADPSEGSKDLHLKLSEFLKDSRNSADKRGLNVRKKKMEVEFYDSEKGICLNGDLVNVKYEKVDNKETKGKHKCKFCEKAFNHKSTLSRHKLLVHSANPPVFTCDHCKKQYKTKVSLRRHIQSVYTSQNQGRKTFLKVNCALCDHQCTKTDMLVHYETVHGTTIVKEIIRFNNEDAFHIWKDQTEIETTSRFTKIRKDRIVKDGTKESFYRCHRDGVYKPRGQNLRNLKKIGSNKINGHCPAKMQVWIDQNNEVSVLFVKTHVGHEMDISRLTLTKQERDQIARQLALQVPFDTILEACRESAVGAENIRRMNLLTRKDLYNIESSYSLSKLTYRNCLGVNVDGWVKDMVKEHCDSFLKFYKPQGGLLDDYPQLELGDFMLVLMNEAQVEVLKGGGDDYLCVDITNIVSDFSLVTILVLDEREQGFPACFMLTSKISAVILETLFATLKEAASRALKPRIFVSNLDDVVYKSWNAVMTTPSFRVYSPWIVDEDWRSNLERITNPEKQVDYYNKLVTILEETNVQTFEDELDQTYRTMKTDPETSDFAQFFETYKSKASAWAHCFRAHLGVNVNEQLERLQASLKVVYERKVKKISQLEKFIFSLMSSVKEHLFDSLVSFNSNFLERMKSDYEERHALAAEIPKNALVKKPRHWNVSIPDTDKQYKVKVLNQDCVCAHSCPDCQACTHGYICSCIDSSLKWIVCEHVHAVCMKIKSGNNFTYRTCDDESSEVQFQILDEDNVASGDDQTRTDLIINVPESAYQYMTVPAEGEDGNVLLTFETGDLEDNAELILGYAEEDPDVNVEERRSLLAQKCQNILNRISSEAQVVAFEQAMATLETEVTFID